MRRPFSWRGWKTRPFAARLSGTTLAPSTAALGVAQWISSVRDIPASPSPQPGEDAATKTRGIFGPMWRGSSRRSGRQGYSLKTSRGTSPWDLGTSPASYANWAIRSARACSRRLNAARAIAGAVYSCWPTPTVAHPGARIEINLSPERLAIFSPEPGTGGKQISIHRMAQQWTTLWRLNMALGWTPGPAPKYPYSHPVHVRLGPGTRSSPETLTSNPAFLEWVMGWPIGWTDTQRPVTGWSLWLQRSRTELSAALSRAREDAAAHT